jgi:hypothetical protein
MIGKYDWIFLPYLIAQMFMENHIMSNQHTAVMTGEMAAAPARKGPSFLRRLFDAWVRSYDSRIDKDGNIICEH